jgi:hypothetical protein
MPAHEYWIKFHNHPPERLYYADLMELMRRVEYLIQYHGRPFDWLVRE